MQVNQVVQLALQSPSFVSTQQPAVVQAEVTQVKEAMQRRVEEAVAEAQTKASGLRDAREKNVHFSARVSHYPGKLQGTVMRSLLVRW